MKALEGLKVVDLSWVVAGPLIGRTLADYGATVIRIESSKRMDTARAYGPFIDGKPDLEGSALYANCNAGKLGCVLDLQNAKAREVVLDLVRWADVLLESFSRGVMDRFGLGQDVLREANPRLISLSTSLLGSTGPYGALAGYGNTGSALSGLQYLGGWVDRLPRGPFGPFSDFVGPRFGLAVLLASLLRRDADGVGRQLDVSQVEATIHFLAPEIADYVHNGVVAERSGNRDVAMSPNGVYACIGDETWIAITAHTDAEWQTLAMFVGGADLSVDERFHSLEGRKTNEDILESILRAWAARQDADDLEVRLQALGIAAHKVARSADLVKDPQLASDGFFIPLDHPKHGSVTVEGSRFTLSSTPAQINRAGPTQGQDTEFVMTSILGYDPERIDQLRAAKAFE